MVGSVCVGHAQEKNDTLREIVVTGTGTERLLKNAPVQTEVISRKVLDTYGGKSIEDILSGLTASFAFNEGDMGSQMQLGGLGNSYILILVDGKRLHGDNGGENDLGLIDPHNIERIEIVKGAQSALYGSDAIAGVVNIITKKHVESGLYLENTTRYGTHNDVRQHDGVGFSIGKLNSYTNFQLQHTDGWQNTSDEYAEAMVKHNSMNKTVNAFTNWQVAERLNYQVSPALSLYADGSYYTKQINRPQHGNIPSCDVYTYDLMYRNASASLGGKWNIGDSHDFISLDVDWNKHAYYYKYFHRTYEYVKLVGEEYGDLNGEWYSLPWYPGQKNLQSNQERTMGLLKGVFYLPYENTINTGIEYRYDYLEAPARTDNGKAHDWTASFYAQDEFNQIKWLNVTAGFRLVRNESFGTRFTPKVSTMVSLGDFRLRLGWSQGFKTPTVKELNYRYLHVMGSSTFFNIGNKNLDPQTSNYYNAGLEYGGKKFNVSVTGYVNKLDNMIALVNVPVGEIPAGVTTAYLGDGSGHVIARMYKNMEDAKTYGVDLTMKYTLTKELSINGAYSYLNTIAHQYDDAKMRFYEVTIDGMAHHKWSASLAYVHPFSKSYKLGVNLSTRGSSKRFYQNNRDGKAFQLWRLNTTHDFGRSSKALTYRVEAGVDNIFNYVDRTMRPYHLGNNTSGTTVYGAFVVKFNQGKKVARAALKSQRTDEE